MLRNSLDPDSGVFCIRIQIVLKTWLVACAGEGGGGGIESARKGQDDIRAEESSKFAEEQKLDPGANRADEKYFLFPCGNYRSGCETKNDIF